MGERNETVDALRCLAALAVCLFHFTRFDYFDDVSALEPIARYGGLGVEVFFVISGFIVPYAMLRGGYSLRTWPRFMWKRLLRLEPPYLVSIGLVLAVDIAAIIAAGSHGERPPWTPAQVASHIGYLTGFVGYSWLNPVYWSLAIELQFYFLCSVLVPALVALTRQILRVAVVLALAALPAVLPSASPLTLLPYLPIFALGLMLFLGATGLVTPRLLWAGLVTLIAVLLATLPLPVTLAGVAAALAIAFVRMPRLRPIAWLAAISYSLYLVHVPIGGSLIMFGTRFVAVTAWHELALVMLALAVAVCAACALYVTVERPSRLLAARIRYAAAGGLA